jgi:hypothetical protein
LNWRFDPAWHRRWTLLGVLIILSLVLGVSIAWLLPEGLREAISLVFTLLALALQALAATNERHFAPLFAFLRQRALLIIAGELAVLGIVVALYATWGTAYQAAIVRIAEADRPIALTYTTETGEVRSLTADAAGDFALVIPAWRGRQVYVFDWQQLQLTSEEGGRVIIERFQPRRVIDATRIRRHSELTVAHVQLEHNAAAFFSTPHISLDTIPAGDDRLERAIEMGACYEPSDLFEAHFAAYALHLASAGGLSAQVLSRSIEESLRDQGISADAGTGGVLQYMREAIGLTDNREILATLRRAQVHANAAGTRLDEKGDYVFPRGANPTFDILLENRGNAEAVIRAIHMTTTGLLVEELAGGSEDVGAYSIPILANVVFRPGATGGNDVSLSASVVVRPSGSTVAHIEIDASQYDISNHEPGLISAWTGRFRFSLAYGSEVVSPELCVALPIFEHPALYLGR